LLFQKKNFNPDNLRANFSVNKSPWTILYEKDWDPEMIKLAIKTQEISGLDFAGIDIMTSSSHKNPMVICEINSKVGFGNNLIVPQLYANYFLSKIKHYINE